SFALPLQISAEGSSESIVKGMELTDVEGQNINLNDVVEKQAVEVHVFWSFEDVDVEESVTETYTLPEELHIEEEQQGTLLHNETEVGTFKIFEDGTVTLALNDTADEHSGASGKITILASAGIETNVEEKKKDNETEAEKQSEAIEDEIKEHQEKNKQTNKDERSHSKEDTRNVNLSSEEKKKKESEREARKQSKANEYEIKYPSEKNKQTKTDERIQSKEDAINVNLSSEEITENIITVVHLSQKIEDGDFEELEPGTE